MADTPRLPEERVRRIAEDGFVRLGALICPPDDATPEERRDHGYQTFSAEFRALAREVLELREAVEDQERRIVALHVNRRLTHEEAALLTEPFDVLRRPDGEGAKDGA